MRNRKKQHVQFELKNELRRLRFDNGEMTQQQLANRLGISRQTVHSIERGKFNPSVKLALRIAKSFGKQLEEVFYLEEASG